MVYALSLNFGKLLPLFFQESTDPFIIIRDRAPIHVVKNPAVRKNIIFRNVDAGIHVKQAFLP